MLWIAYAIMLLDHTILGGGSTVGAVGWTIFSWGIAQGEKYTSDFWRYFLRVFVLAVVSQPFYMLFFQTYFLNPVFSLSFGLLLIRTYKQNTIFFIFLVLSIYYYTGHLVYIFIVLTFLFSLPGFVWILFYSVLLYFNFTWSFYLSAVTAFVLYFCADLLPRPGSRYHYYFYPSHMAILWGLRYV